MRNWQTEKEKYQKLSTIDGLTKVLNRHGIEQFIESLQEQDQPYEVDEQEGDVLLGRRRRGRRVPVGRRRRGRRVPVGRRCVARRNLKLSKFVNSLAKSAWLLTCT